MKDETIKPGDLVRVAYPSPCCGRIQSTHGKVYYVSRIVDMGPAHCIECMKPIGNAICAQEVGVGFGAEIRVLQKIHPPELPETVDERQEVEA